MGWSGCGEVQLQPIVFRKGGRGVVGLGWGGDRGGLTVYNLH